MPLGKKVFDVYGELHLDKDEVRQGLRGLAGEMGSEADRAGQDLGKRMSDGIARSVEASSARVAKARRAEVDAANAVKVAELRLNEAREKGKAPASQMLALENALEKAHYRLSQAQSNTVTSTKKLEDAQRLLARSMDDVGKGLGPRAEKAGDDAGGKLAMGMRMSIVRNSPLIAAAVGGALIAGAPALLTAATGLFAGIGIVAAAQSLRVQQAWRGTWQQIKDGATADAAPIEGVLVRVAGNVGAAFQRMRPQLQGAFSAAAPQIEVFAGGITRLAENALPGLVRAVEAGMPVTKGLADFLAKTGTGVSDLFDRISAHGPAAGKVWSELGTTMGTLLPMLGELIGQGAELGATVLPMLNGGLGLVLNVVEHLDGALPVLLGYFGGMKIISTVGGWAQALGGVMNTLGGKSIPLVSAAAQSMGTTLMNAGGAAKAGGPAVAALAVTVGLLMAAHQQSEERVRAWTQALGQGGAAARAAREEMAAQDAQVRQNTSGIFGFALSMTAAAPAVSELKRETEAADAANLKYVAGLSPLEAAQRNLKIAEEGVSQAIKDHGTGSDEAAAAGDRYRAAQYEVEVQEGRLKTAIEGVTQALADQANQARSRVDASFAYEQSILQVKEAQDKLNEVMADPKSSPSKVESAVLALNRAYEGTVTAAGDIARSNLPSAMDDTQKSILGAKAELDRLNELIAQGVKLPDSMEQYRRQLEQITGQADGAKLAQAQLAGALGELGFAVNAVPNAKAITITAPTDAVKAKLAELGFTITKLPNGDVQVTAETDQAKGNLGNLSTLLAGLTATTATPAVTVDPTPAQGSIRGIHDSLVGLDGQRPTPIANLNTGPFAAYWQNAMTNIGILTGQRPTPVAGLQDNASGGLIGIKQRIDALYSKTITITTRQVTAQGGSTTAERNAIYGASGGKVGDLVGLAGGGNVGRAVRAFGMGGSPRRRSDGRVEGPGGPLDDLVPAITNMGEPVHIANTEWIVKGMSAAAYGDRKMGAVNAGTAEILLPDDPRYGQRPRRFADGGIPNPATGTGQMNRSPITVENLNVTFSGADLTTDRRSMRQAAVMLRDEIIKLEKEQS